MLTWALNWLQELSQHENLPAIDDVLLEKAQDVSTRLSLEIRMQVSLPNMLVILI